MPNANPVIEIVTEAPPAMGIDDALVIADKLGDVYAGRDKGYCDGWSDKRVSEDLNVPRDWVRQIREKRFGPAGDSEEARSILAEARTVLEGTSAMVREFHNRIDRVNEISTKIKALISEAARIEKSVDQEFRDKLAECSRTIGRIEKSISAIEKAVA